MQHCNSTPPSMKPTIPNKSNTKFSHMECRSLPGVWAQLAHTNTCWDLKTINMLATSLALSRATDPSTG
eukprot:6399855-Lingulodinium_polyedra.AAC.1